MEKQYTLIKILNRQGKTLVNEVVDVAEKDIEIRFYESDKESFEYIGTSKGICRGCFSIIDIASWNGCPIIIKKLAPMARVFYVLFYVTCLILKVFSVYISQ